MKGILLGLFLEKRHLSPRYSLQSLILRMVNPHEGEPREAERSGTGDLTALAWSCPYLYFLVCKIKTYLRQHEFSLVAKSRLTNSIILENILKIAPQLAFCSIPDFSLNIPTLNYLRYLQLCQYYLPLFCTTPPILYLLTESSQSWAKSTSVTAHWILILDW